MSAVEPRGAAERSFAAGSHPLAGTAPDELDTPALCLDLEVMQSNIARMIALCRRHGVGWRPHAKGHKSPEIARRQLAAGALGVTCAKLGEAEIMAQAGIADILIANQVVGPKKLERLAALRRLADPIVAVDDPLQVDALDAAMRGAGLRLRVVVEVDVGLARAGTRPGTATLELAQRVDRAGGLELAGLMGYEGHLLTVPDPAQKEAQIRRALAALIESRDVLQAAGLPCPIVSAGGTGSVMVTPLIAGITEVQAGGLIFMDAFYRQRCGVEDFDFALWLTATVVSRPAPQRAIIDAGRKSHNAEIHAPFVWGRPDLKVVQLSAEHGTLEVAAGGPGLAIGDRLRIVPGYADFTCVLHDEFFVVERGRVCDVWPLAARGKIR